VRKRATPLQLLVVGSVILVATVLALVQIRSSDYLLLPDPAHPAAPLVTVQGGHDRAGSGGVYFVDVLERHASVLEKLIPQLRGDGASLVKPTAVIPPGANAEVARRVARDQMETSQEFAAAVALRSLGYPVKARASGVLVDAVVPESDANGKIVPGDIVVGVDGKPTSTIESLFTRIRSHRIGDVVVVRFRREGEPREARVRLTRAAPGSQIPVVGLSQLEQAATVRLPRRVTIKAGRVGGPSAGLAFALQIREELGRDVTRGNRVVATGAIGLDGDVEPVGGIKQKTFGARKAHADVFLVPAGANAREARRYAGDLRIIPVATYAQALRSLAKLPPKR
jgi:PDZ domain-containing protein